MEKEAFRKEVKKLLANAYQRMVKHVDSFCDTDYEGFDSYKEDVSQMDFVNVLLSLEARNHSAIGCSEGVKRKSKNVWKITKHQSSTTGSQTQHTS